MIIIINLINKFKFKILIKMIIHNIFKIINRMEVKIYKNKIYLNVYKFKMIKKNLQKKIKTIYSKIFIHKKNNYFSLQKVRTPLKNVL